MIGLGILWLTPGGAAQPMTIPEITLSALPLATPIEVTPENAALLGFGSSTGRFAMASDHQVSAAVAASSASSVDHDPTVPQETRVQVRLMDGSVTGARVVTSRSGVALVELDTPSEDPGRPLASLAPNEAEEVVVLAEKPHRLTYAELARDRERADNSDLQLVAGTPVVTADGELLGICVEHEQGDHTHFIPISELLSDAISQGPTPQSPQGQRSRPQDP